MGAFMAMLRRIASHCTGLCPLLSAHHIRFECRRRNGATINRQTNQIPLVRVTSIQISDDPTSTSRHTDLSGAEDDGQRARGSRG